MLFHESGEFFLARLALVPEEAWGNATPCPDWTVRDVAVHVINGFRLVPTLLAQEPVNPADRNRDTLGGNLTEAGSVALEAAAAALRRPGALDAEVNAPAGVMPARMFAMVRMADTVIHTWDMSSGAGIVVSIPAPLDMSHVWMTVSAIRTMANILAGITPAGAFTSASKAPGRRSAAAAASRATLPASVRFPPSVSLLRSAGLTGSWARSVGTSRKPLITCTATSRTVQSGHGVPLPQASSGTKARRARKNSPDSWKSIIGSTSVSRFATVACTGNSEG